MVQNRTMPRNLRLTEKQEAKFADFLKKRLVELDADNDDRIKADRKSDEDYENDKKARAVIGSIYAESNMPVPLTSTVVDHFASQSEEELFGRKPFCRFTPEGPADADTARGLDRFAGYKLFTQCGVDKELNDCNHTAFRHRALILKAVYHEDFDEWAEYDLSVLHQYKDNSPLFILNHGYVIEGRDRWLDVVDPATGLPTQVLEVDPTVTLDESLYYYAPLAQPIRFKDVLFSGAKSIEVDSDCFRAPSTARSLDEADTIAEYYDKSGWWIRDRFLDRPWITWDKYRTKAVQNANASRKTNDDRRKLAKEARAFDLEAASIGIVEVWCERDVLEWGRPQRIVAWYDKRNDVFIDYEFQKLVTPTGRHPYSAIAIAKTRKTWAGRSIPEILAPFQEYIDRQWNRHSFRNSINANPILAQNPDAIQERKSFIDLKPFDVMTLEAGKTVQDWLQAFVFPNADTDTQELIDKAIYWVHFWLGISNIARGDYSDVPQNTTLGGQEASLKEASKLSRRWTRRLRDGYEEHLTKLVRVLLATMNPQEAYTYLEGEENQLGFITEDSVRDMTINAKIVVGASNTTQKMQEQQLTLQTITQYLAYPPQVQATIRPVMKTILFLLGHDDVETLLPPPMMPVVDPVTGQTIMVPVTPQTPAPPQSAPNGTTQATPEETNIHPFQAGAAPQAEPQGTTNG